MRHIVTQVQFTMYFTLFIIIMLFFSGIATAQDPNLHIYLCFGQSNMEGVGTVEAQDQTTDSRVKVMGGMTCSNLECTYGNWYTASPPLNRCYSGLGIADYFGKTVVDSMPSNITIGLVPGSVAGYDIAFFQRSAPLGKAANAGGTDAYIPTQCTGGYAWLLDMAPKTQAVGVIKGIIFHQSETNTSDPNWKYKGKEIVNDLRTDLAIGYIPILAGEMLYNGRTGSATVSVPLSTATHLNNMCSNKLLVSPNPVQEPDVEKC